MIDHLVYQEKNAYSMSNRLHYFLEIHHIIDAIQKGEVDSLGQVNTTSPSKNILI